MSEYTTQPNKRSQSFQIFELRFVTVIVIANANAMLFVFDSKEKKNSAIDKKLSKN